MSLIGSGLCLFYHLSLDVFRISTMEIDNYGVTFLETSLSAALTGLTHFLSNQSATLTLVPSLLCTAAHFALARFVRRKYVTGQRFKEVDLTGKVYIITGANAGIGFETCKQLVRMGGTVVMACRSAERANEAKQAILDEVHAPPSKIIFLPLDLGSLDSVRSFAKEFLALQLPLHGLVNNAGLMNSSRQLSKDGLEMMFQANHLGHFLLTKLLLPALEQSSGRVVNLTSVLHKLAKKLDLDDLQAEKYYELFYTYGQTKLSNILFTKELQQRVDGNGGRVTCYAVHPGCVRTEVTRGMHWVMRLGNQLAAPLLLLLQKTPEEGAYCSVFAASDPDLPHRAEARGGYLFHCQLESTGAAAKDGETAKRLWEISEHLIDSCSKK